MQFLIIAGIGILSRLASAWTVDLPYQSVTPVENFSNSSGTILAKPLLAYYSVPYAAPPLNALRFAYPVPPLRNDTTLYNTGYGPVCPQGPSVALQSEDCLTLSVFRPQDSQDQKLPVVIWVPGGELKALSHYDSCELTVQVCPLGSFNTVSLGCECRETYTDSAHF